ncbi:conserved eukaryotic protein [Pelomyxa schiedti]|nr:conserved eukaryotic protein [Pelomyxa schiedti]
MSATLPPQQNTIFEQVRESCARVSLVATDCQISQDGIERFVKFLEDDQSGTWTNIATTQPFIFGANVAANKVTLEFVSVDAEINMLSVLDVLQIGCGYRKILHHYCNLGASDVMTRGITSLHKEMSNLTASALNTINAAAVARHFGFSEEAMSNPLIRQLTEIIVSVLVGSGNALLSAGYPDFSSMVRHCSTIHTPPLANDLVSTLFEKIPAFKDMAEYPTGQPVYLMKKAQLLAGDLYRRFAKELPDLFAYSDITELTVFVDNVLPAVLRHFGVIIPSSRLTSAIEGQVDIPAQGELEVQLRAVAVRACELIIKHTRTLPESNPLHHLTTLDLDWFLWVVGKRPGIRSVERHVCQTTVYY